jgi:hypothetical protein
LAIGTKGEAREFDLPRVVLDQEGRVYVADRENGRIGVHPDGRFVAQWTGWIHRGAGDDLTGISDGRWEEQQDHQVARDGRLLARTEAGLRENSRSSCDRARVGGGSMSRNPQLAHPSSCGR